MTTEDFRKIPLAELERMWVRKRDELVALKREIDRRKGDEPKPVSVDFEKYITK